MPLRLTAGVSYDTLEQQRRGYLNYAGAELGVEGALRLDQGNQADDVDEYLQLEWDPWSRWRVLAGVRHSEVDIISRNHLSGSAPASDIRFVATNPVFGLTFRASDALSAYASFGRGFETPTLNDLAYRSTNGTLPGGTDFEGIIARSRPQL